MKHKFLLDENVLYHYVKGVDAHDNPDSTATELILLIGKNCHSITIDSKLWQKYWTHLKLLQRERPKALEPLFFITQLMKNSAKALRETSDAPELPPDVVIPREDDHVVRAALISHPLVVTSDEELKDAINNQPALSLRALTLHEAIELAKEQ